ncbi:MAG: NupC/NupG family nucleoside CNT transporter [Alphaproteobacteria bacterium]|nr:NupC/NupG family nucleoside CNT transporter [Alphaproteobacteria bacterium]
MRRRAEVCVLWLWVATAAAAEGRFVPHTTTWLERGTSALGLLALVGLAWLLSENRRGISWKPVLWGTVAQLALGLVVLSPAAAGFFYGVVDGAVNQLLAFSEEGATFVFGTIEPHEIVIGGEAQTIVGKVSPPVKTFAFWILPTIVFFSSLMAVLYHLGVMQLVVEVLARAMVRTLGTSGAESLSAAGNIFVGQTEAPLLVRPFVGAMTRSELMAVMTGGFATVAGGVMGAYVKFLDDIPNIAGHLVMASILSAPAALAIAKVMVPEDGEPATRGAVKVSVERNAANVMEAAANGATDGMKLALNVGAMLIAIVGLVAMVDFAVGHVPVGFCPEGPVAGWTCAGEVAAEPLTLARILGWVFAPVALVMGVPLSDVVVVGGLLGEKIVLTEFVAYIHLGAMLGGDTPVITERGAVIASYALCGFANFASIGIQLGGIGGIAPERMGDLASLGVRAMLGGALAACMTGAVAGLLL